MTCNKWCLKIIKVLVFTFILFGFFFAYKKYSAIKASKNIKVTNQTARPTTREIKEEK